MLTFQIFLSNTLIFIFYLGLSITLQEKITENIIIFQPEVAAYFHLTSLKIGEIGRKFVTVLFLPPDFKVLLNSYF